MTARFPSAKRVMRAWSLEWMFFAVSAVIVTWPLVVRMSSAMPRGTEAAATVPLFNLWTLWWNAAWIGSSAGYWNAPIFAPTEEAFALSEPQPTMMAVAPIVWCGGSAALAYNAYLLLALWLNGLSAAQLLRAAGVRRSAAVAGGLFVQWLPFVHWQIGVLQLLPLFGEMWTVLTLIRLAERPSFWGGVRLGLAFGLAYLTCENLGLFFFVLMVASAPWLVWRAIRVRKFWGSLFCGTVIAGALIAPVVVVQTRTFRNRDFSRTRELAISLSAHPADYSVTFASPAPVGDLSTPERRVYWPFSPGWIKVALAIIGAALGLPRSERRRWAAFAVSFLIVAWLLSLGPEARWKGLAPYDALRAAVPGFEHVRNVFRFALFAQLATAWLAACGIDEIQRLVEGRSTGEERSPGRVKAAQIIAATAAVLGCIESWPLPQSLIDLPRQDLGRGWPQFLRDETPRDAIVICLPMPANSDVVAYEVESWWMYSQLAHRRSLANGYSGYFPQAYMQLQAASHRFPDEASLRAIAEAGITCVVVDRRRYGDLGESLGNGSVWRRVFADSVADIDLYHRHPSG